ncbi:hypothetical protein [Tolypothrix sp. VBCCA 56010]|uniref:hypothetical protein n=1 Tax=Tolypothrix sp. VBCCA 56010 TaxID=3137731 RepID=UPI003D7E49BC
MGSGGVGEGRSGGVGEWADLADLADLADKKKFLPHPPLSPSPLSPPLLLCP